MEASVTIDPKSGSILVGQFLITPQLKVSELSEDFSIELERQVMVLGKLTPCQFAAIQITIDGQPLRIELRFENTVLVSCFFTFPGVVPDNEARICSQWLNKQLGTESGLARFSWGSAGVATDRSGSSYVFMHNKNNSWAH